MASLLPLVRSVGAQGEVSPLTTKLQPSRMQLERLRQALAPLDAKYDPAEQMLKEPFSSPGYHTVLNGGFIHSTRSSLNYAVALLDTCDESLRPRAEAILLRVIGLQDQDPASKTYGIWSWFLEEPLDKMSPPDWNWADFCGTALLQVALDHRERLSPAVMAKADAAIRHAANSIRKRNVGPAYTNIAIMGTYVTLVAAELYNLPDLKEYAVGRWRRFYDYTLDNEGSLAEYNSPTYTIVALKELARMRQHVKDPEARRITEEIFRLAWREIAQHFHPPTRQWAGPHSRCYQTLLGQDALALLSRATNGHLDFGTDKPSLDEVRLVVPCPAEFEPSFQTLDAPRQFRQTFVKGDRPVIGTTYLHPRFALGSVNRGDLWNQRRPLLAYWGSPQSPAYLRLRFLHDDYDFTAAQFFSMQDEGRVLGGINFAVDGGDRHPSLDRIKNGTIHAKDLRLRFEFGGAAARSGIAEPEPGKTWASSTSGDLRVTVSVPYAKWGTEPARWDAGSDKSASWVDMVLYTGPEKEFKLAELKEAVCAFAVEFAPGSAKHGEVRCEVEDGRLRANWAGLALELPVQPATLGSLQKTVRMQPAVDR